MISARDGRFETVGTGFESRGTRCAATVYRPIGDDRPRPVVVMAQGFGGVRILRLPAYAERFAAAGYMVVLFDYRFFGDSDGEPRQLLDVAAQLEDWRSAVSWARSLDDVDPAAAIAWGTSFAGGHVLSIASQGLDLAAVIAQVPHTSGPAAVRSTGARAAWRLAPVAFRDTWRAIRKGPPVYVDSIGSPGDTAVMTAPGAQRDLDVMADASGVRRSDLDETVAARIVLRIGLYSPGRRAARIRCPVLIQAATDDQITPTRSAERTARRIPDCRYLTYRGGHFSPYVAPLFDSVVRDQLGFLHEVIPVGG